MRHALVSPPPIPRLPAPSHVRRIFHDVMGFVIEINGHILLFIFKCIRFVVNTGLHLLHVGCQCYDICYDELWKIDGGRPKTSRMMFQGVLGSVIGVNMRNLFYDLSLITSQFHLVRDQFLIVKKNFPVAPPTYEEYFKTHWVLSLIYRRLDFAFHF